ncbi:hypothetical protein DN36_3462 [Vibrio cholerae]|nr:hypothetical protein DN36_3462 [Vibrio cholerae]
MLLLAAHSAAAACRNDITASTPDQDFTLHNDGTVTHNSTGLMWMRCSLGQNWDGSTCTGTASTFTWQNALAAAQSNDFAGYSDWRLPNKNELASLVEQRCVSPAINSAIFPGTPGTSVTPGSWFWSSSPSADNSDQAWGVLSNYGFANVNNKDNSYRVRLVRAGQ